jgi:hypothetical protein
MTTETQSTADYLGTEAKLDGGVELTLQWVAVAVAR